jgi:hypothetical protein
MCYAGLDPVSTNPPPINIRSVFDDITEPLVALMTIAKADKRSVAPHSRRVALILLLLPPPRLPPPQIREDHHWQPVFQCRPINPPLASPGHVTMATPPPLTLPPPHSVTQDDCSVQARRESYRASRSGWSAPSLSAPPLSQLDP